MKLSPVTVFYVRNLFDAFSSGLIFTSIYAFYVREIGMSPFQLLLIGTMIMVTGFLFETPTGVVADLYSRKLSVIIGGVLIGVCFILTGAIPLYSVALMAAFIEAIGDTFVSGALDAWISDEVGAERVGQLWLRAAQLGTPAHWLGIGASILLATWFNYQVPIILGGALWLVVSLLLWWVMPETGFVRPQSPLSTVRFSLRPPLQSALDTLRTGIKLVRTTPLLLFLFTAELFVGGFFEGFFRLYRVHFLTNFTLPTLTLPWIGALDEVVWFGILDALSGLLGMAGMEIALRKLRLDRAALPARLLLLVYGAIILCVIGFAFSRYFALAVITFLLIKFLVELADPITKSWLNLHLAANVRATVLSMRSQVSMVGQLGGGLGVGIVANFFGLRVALALAGLLLTPLLVLYNKWAEDNK